MRPEVVILQRATLNTYNPGLVWVSLLALVAAWLAQTLLLGSAIRAFPLAFGAQTSRARSAPAASPGFNAENQTQLHCLMAPEHVQIPLPENGITWLQGEDQSGPCEEVLAERWLHRLSGKRELFVYTYGPSGSGRHWTVTVGVAGAGGSKPQGGVCFTTSTVGWRTLQSYKNSPLVWLDDLDDDGSAELILFTSFPLRKDASLAEFGLTAWVYRLAANDKLVIDWDLSRQMARDLAAAYRLPLAGSAQHLNPLRAQAAAALEDFGKDRCAVPAK